MSLIDLIQQNIGQNEIQEISQQIGADPDTTEQAIQAALPMMIGGMASTAQHPAGEDAIRSLMSTAGGGQPDAVQSLGGLGGILGGGGIGGVLGSILGQHHDTVRDGVQKSSGLDAGKVGKLLMLLAPFVIRAMSKHQQSPAQQDGSIAGSLQQEATNAMQGAQSPHIGGILGKILGSAMGQR